MFRLFLCLLVIGAHTHCVMAHGAALVNDVEAERLADPPIGESETCKNESGCLCKGAVIPKSLSVLNDGDLIDCLWSTHQVIESDSLAAFDRNLHSLSRGSPALSGASVRIFLQSFQI